MRPSPPALSAGMDELTDAFPHLSKPQVKGLALYALGIIMAGRCGLSCVAYVLAQWMGQSYNTVRERLRDWYCSAPDKSGRQRRDLDVQACFAPLLAWILKSWAGTQLALALDATTLGQRFVVLTLSVLYRSSAIPVAWVILPANVKHRWKPEWLALLERLRPAVPPSMQVLVLADRGLYARWLFRAITQAGWHPFLRINLNNAEFCPEGGRHVPIRGLLPHVGSQYAARGVMFRSVKARLPCTLCAVWSEGCAEGWFVVTDLAPEQAQAGWYGLRSWIERGFKHTKSGGWNWQETRMEDPQRAQRQWLAMAVADVWAMREGSQQEPPPDPPPAVAGASPEAKAPGPGPGSTKKKGPKKARRKRARPNASGRRKPETKATTSPRRTLSVFRMGIIALVMLLLSGTLPSHGQFVPEPWPDTVPGLTTSSHQDHPP
jgi:hypothetical protein